MQAQRPALSTLIALVAAFAVASGLVLLNPTAAAAVQVPDADCPGPVSVTATLSGSDPDTYGQSFTAEHSGALTRADLVVTEIGPADVFTIQVRTVDAGGFPTDTVLATTAVSGLPTTTSPASATVSGTFLTPATVTLGSQYALVLTGPDYGMQTASDATCTGGRGFAFIPGTGWIDANVGTDRIFATFVTLPECSDGTDNDLDGATDFPADTGCTGANDVSELAVAAPTPAPTATPTAAPSSPATAPSAVPSLASGPAVGQLPDTQASQSLGAWPAAGALLLCSTGLVLSLSAAWHRRRGF
ncbi:MAG: hypothetical protein ACXWWQ_00745 [Candidatus Limnocylindria bacterium]